MSSSLSCYYSLNVCFDYLILVPEYSTTATITTIALTPTTIEFVLCHKFNYCCLLAATAARFSFVAQTYHPQNHRWRLSASRSHSLYLSFPANRLLVSFPFPSPTPTCCLYFITSFDCADFFFLFFALVCNCVGAFVVSSCRRVVSCPDLLMPQLSILEINKSTKFVNNQTSLQLQLLSKVASAACSRTPCASPIRYVFPLQLVSERMVLKESM